LTTDLIPDVNARGLAIRYNSALFALHVNYKVGGLPILRSLTRKAIASVRKTEKPAASASGAAILVRVPNCCRNSPANRLPCGFSCPFEIVAKASEIMQRNHTELPRLLETMLRAR
jgi:hypothetical protein